MLDTAQRERPSRTISRTTFFSQVHAHGTFGDYCPAETWQPAVNIYRLADCMVVCFDLAGVGKKQIEVRVQPGQLTVRGARLSPEPACDPAARKSAVMRIITMEINHGAFCRTVSLPQNIDLDGVESQHRNGLLWVRLPMCEGDEPSR
jgi:HSP20 family protein